MDHIPGLHEGALTGACALILEKLVTSREAIVKDVIVTANLAARDNLMATWVDESALHFKSRDLGRSRAGLSMDGVVWGALLGGLLLRLIW
jgi:hypothetical protein